MFREPVPDFSWLGDQQIGRHNLNAVPDGAERIQEDGALWLLPYQVFERPIDPVHALEKGDVFANGIFRSRKAEAVYECPTGNIDPGIISPVKIYMGSNLGNVHRAPVAQLVFAGIGEGAQDVFYLQAAVKARMAELVVIEKDGVLGGDELIQAIYVSFIGEENGFLGNRFVFFTESQELRMKKPVFFF